MQRAFSLVELSIVLVILGLLTGGILAGQSLIHAAQLRAQLRDFDSLRSAHYSFRDKYLCLPGDCASISQFFSTIANGNGDGRVDCWPSSGTNECGTYNEAMESAGLIEMRRAAFTSTPEYRSIKSNNDIGYIHFEDRYPGGGYTPATLLGSGRAWINFIRFNSPWANGPVLIPQDAWNFDVKIDDAKPQTGTYMSANAGVGASYNTTCINGSAEYMLETSGVACRSFYKIE